jgi:hypothetical protein
MRSRAARIARFIVFGVVFFLLFGFVVEALWNWLMPALFGLHAITFWQGLGLLLLSKILFSGFRGGHWGHRGHWGGWRRRMAERWEQMSPEEREKFREAMRARCGSFRGAEPEKPKA